jgi:hypothetical protein
VVSFDRQTVHFNVDNSATARIPRIWCPLFAVLGLLIAAYTAGAEPCIQTTHGCVALNPDVTEATARQTICVAGYAKSVRPSRSYTTAVKLKLLREAGLPASRMRDFELDHIVPLALGGHPRNLTNLALQQWNGEHGAHRKDDLENRLHSLVCRGEVTLTAAQVCLAVDWEACAVRYRRKEQGISSRTSGRGTICGANCGSVTVGASLQAKARACGSNQSSCKGESDTGVERGNGWWVRSAL